MAEGGHIDPKGGFALLALLGEIELREYGALCRNVRESLGLSLENIAGDAALEPSQLEVFEKGLATPGVIPTPVLLRLSMTLLAYQYVILLEFGMEDPSL